MTGPRRRFAAPFLALVLLAGLALGATQCPLFGDFPAYVTIELDKLPGETDEEFETRVRLAFIDARPGTIFQFGEGTYRFTNSLILDTSHVTVRGRGMYRTILSFAGQERGAEGLLVRADAFVLQSIGIEDTGGDGVRVEAADGVVFEYARVEWTRGPHPENGAYGVYPVASQNVLVQNCVVRGAQDAGIYVGQSDNIVVRKNLVYDSVAGIEIENSTKADVTLNELVDNTGGILVFDLPNLQKQGGNGTRVFRNYVHNNDQPNFGSGFVANVPAGTGILIVANDDIEIFENLIYDNKTVAIAVVGFAISFISFDDPRYDPWPEKINIHDNVIVGGGTAPDGLLGGGIAAKFTAFGAEMPQIVWDGDINPIYGDSLPPDLQLCILDNGDATFGNFNGLGPIPPSNDVTPHLCSHPALAPIVLRNLPPRPEPEGGFTEEQIAALCNAPGSGPNWDAFVVDCPNLGDYRLFEGGDPTATPLGGGLPYDLTTALFSDYASKYRVVFLPPAEAAGYRADDTLEFPVGTIIAKTFTFPDDLGDPGSPETVVETRLLIHRTSGWASLPYIFPESGGDAVLTRVGGSRTVTFEHPDRGTITTEYQIPDVNQCASCHDRAGLPGTPPIGPRPDLLNRDYDYASGTANQLQHWVDVGALMDAPADVANAAPRTPPWDDPAAGTLDERARGYLDINCAHCHSEVGRARTTGLFLDLAQPLDINYGICKIPVAAGSGSGGLDFNIVPGVPSQSIMVFRMNSLEGGIQMPEIAKSLVHTEAMQDVVIPWVESLGPLFPDGCPDLDGGGP